MNKINNRVRKQRGAALIMTLIAITIVAMLSVGIGNLVLGHLQSATTDRDAVRALHLAEIGLNFQAQRISSQMERSPQQFLGTNLSTATYGTETNALPVTNLLPTSVQVLFRISPEESFSCKTWVHPRLNLYNRKSDSSQWLYTESIVNDVKRTFRVRLSTIGVFDQWACFGIDTLYLRINKIAISGPGIANRFVNAAIGTNRLIRMNGNPTLLQKAGDDQPVPGVITVHGVDPSAAQVPNRFLEVAAPYKYSVGWPTITKIANQEAAYCKYDFPGTDPPSYRGSLSENAGIANFAGNNDNTAFGVCRRNSDQIRLPFPNDGRIPSGATLSLRGQGYGANFYLTGLNVGGSNGTITVDVSDGPVNLWIDSSATGIDDIAGSINVMEGSEPASSPDQFHIYYRNVSGGRLRLNGQAPGGIAVAGMFYAYDNDEGADNDANDYTDDYDDPGTCGTIEVVGTVSVNGSLIAGTVDLGSLVPPGQSDITIRLSDNSGASPGEGLLYFGFTMPWYEVDPVRGH